MSDGLGVEIVMVGVGSGRAVCNMAMKPSIRCLEVQNSRSTKSH